VILEKSKAVLAPYLASFQSNEESWKSQSEFLVPSYVTRLNGLVRFQTTVMNIFKLMYFYCGLLNIFILSIAFG
jgi:hypothetical protein